MDCKVTSIKRRSAGVSLASTVIGMGLALLASAALATFYLYCARSFVCQDNYMELDGRARSALDVMSSDIREADCVTSYSSNALTLKVGTNLLSYALNTDRKLIRQFGSTKTTLLMDCDFIR